MMVVQPTARWRQQIFFSVFVFLAILFLVLAGVDAGAAEKCAPKFPKWFGCVIAGHESLSGGLIGAGGALLAAWLAWHAIMAQIDSDRAIARKATRAYVTGGPGRRKADDAGRHLGIVSTGMNTGNTPAFTKKVYWGVCKKQIGQLLAKIGPELRKQKVKIGRRFCHPRWHLAIDIRSSAQRRLAMNLLPAGSIAL